MSEARDVSKLEAKDLSDDELESELRRLTTRRLAREADTIVGKHVKEMSDDEADAELKRLTGWR